MVYLKVFLLNIILIKVASMPYKCCVPKCKGNYATGTKVSTFAFPRDLELKNKWLQAIRRENFSPTNHTRVCELHFRPLDIERTTEVLIEGTGELLSARLKHPRLLRDAVPTKLSGSSCSASLSHRKNPRNKKARIKNQKLKKIIVESLAAENAESRTVTPVEVVPEVQSKICRLCLKENDDMQNVHNHSIILKLLFITSVPAPLPGDGFPELICGDCEKRLTDAFSFKNLCEDSDKFLRQSTATSTIKLENDFENLHDVKSTDEYIDNRLQASETQVGCESSDANSLNENEANLGGNEPGHRSVFKNKFENKNGDEFESTVNHPRFNICDRVKHKSETNRVCFICNEQFYSEILFEKHVKTHIPKSPTHVKMKACEKLPSKSHQVKFHEVQSNGTDITRNTGCKNVFPQNLLNHQNRYSGRKVFQCNTCHEKFSEKSGLMNHTMTHTIERSFLCQNCGKSFVDAHILSKHEKSHTRDNLYQCKECMKSFKSGLNLKEHMLTHTGDKRSKCQS